MTKHFYALKQANPGRVTPYNGAPLDKLLSFDSLRERNVATEERGIHSVTAREAARLARELYDSPLSELECRGNFVGGPECPLASAELLLPR